MAAATYIPAKQVMGQVDGTAVVDFNTDTIKALLVREGASRPSTSKTGVLFVSDVTGTNAEVAGGTYARQTLVSPTLAFGAGDDADWSFNDITFAQDAGAGPTDVFYAILYKDVGGLDSTRIVVDVLDIGRSAGVPWSLRTGDLVLKSPSGGLHQYTRSP